MPCPTLLAVVSELRRNRQTTASKRTIVSCSRRPDSRTNILNSQPVKQVWQVFVVVRMGQCLPLLVECEPVVHLKYTSRSKYSNTRYKYTTKYYNFTKYWIKCEKLYIKMTWKPHSVQQNNYKFHTAAKINLYRNSSAVATIFDGLKFGNW
jgi:hypothetical protein